MIQGYSISHRSGQVEGQRQEKYLSASVPSAKVALPYPSGENHDNHLYQVMECTGSGVPSLPLNIHLSSQWYLSPSLFEEIFP